MATTVVVGATAVGITDDPLGGNPKLSHVASPRGTNCNSHATIHTKLITSTRKRMSITNIHHGVLLLSKLVKPLFTTRDLQGLSAHLREGNPHRSRIPPCTDANTRSIPDRRNFAPRPTTLVRTPQFHRFSLANSGCDAVREWEEEEIGQRGQGINYSIELVNFKAHRSISTVIIVMGGGWTRG